MSTHKHTVRKHRKHHDQSGEGFMDFLKKAVDVGKKIKDSGVISKGLDLGSKVAGMAGKSSIANALGNASSTADAFGAGRLGRRIHFPKKSVAHPRLHPKKPKKVATVNNVRSIRMTKKAIVAPKEHMQGEGISDVVTGLAPLVGPLLGMFGLGRHRQHRGGALNLAGMGVTEEMARGGNTVTPSRIIHAGPLHRQRGSGVVGPSRSLGRVSRGTAKMRVL